MEKFDLTILEILFRLLLAILMGGAIGYEREYKSRPAGMKTHILVCVGAAVIALIQQEIAWRSIEFSINNPKLVGVVRSDEARLIAQVVSGIGFLGAGTIVMNKQSVSGLTTAASVWTMAGLGIACGMGYYQIAIVGFLAVLGALTFVTYVVPAPRTRRLLMEMEHWDSSRPFTTKLLRDKGITIDNMDFEVKRLPDDTFRTYSVIYTITIPRDVDEHELMLRLSENPDILKVQILN
ncbi:MgtC/SapB family protein [Candidatus Enterococcus leclercqii]|uniref:MgtC/SapB family protein n=1 Tax=Enterococcus TaxID=1350 RepID=UPI00137998D7|nr:MgtC/SapB family protein [Enterococcus sp. CU9D]KAF1292830.1 magnesium transporter MgtC [Enterococcus sp. CU9D]